MKWVLSVSLGSSKRNHKVEQQFLGEDVIIERRGMDGNVSKMKEMIRQLDGKVDAFGLGGMDLYLSIGGHRYMLREAKGVVACAKKSPIVDGSGLKNSLERKAIEKLHYEHSFFTESDRVLLVCALDRFGMAEKLTEMPSEVIYGDLIFSLGIPVMVRSIRTLNRVARVLMPVVKNLPFRMLYPSGKKDPQPKDRFKKYYDWADIICGDFHFINKYIPKELHGKVIVTNTVTSEDRETLKNKGVRTLVTTTPSLNGRSFGTNVLEALLVALKGQKHELTSTEYEALLEALQFSPAVMDLSMS